MANDHVSTAEKPVRRPPWNKGKLVGAKPPLRPSHVWSIRTKLHMEGLKRDLALFNLAIDSKLRGCDVVAVRVDDVAPSGVGPDRAGQLSLRSRREGGQAGNGAALWSVTQSAVPAELLRFAG